MKRIIILAVLSLAVLFTACDSKGGYIVNTVTLPTDSVLNLYGENEGVYPDINVLSDPENPYATANIYMENIWELYNECPSAKSKFYLWATILAKIPAGEHQFFTALALHELYTVGGSENAREQAKKAYRAVLDHFYGSVTWWKADWLVEDVYYAQLLRDMVGAALYDPSEMNMMALYSDPVMALADLSEWGYIYDFESGKISKWD
ncbi:MAG: hypothetical protein K9N06_13185 [Candidatus Cloacimonetes bacterium]|nr:hypothetical protein [Candidatus Cloacimonadota bacterium]